jgi:hypothetical protein
MKEIQLPDTQASEQTLKRVLNYTMQRVGKPVNIPHY